MGAPRQWESGHEMESGLNGERAKKRGAERRTVSASKSRLCWDENGCLVPRGVACIKAINLCFPLRCLREETGSSLLWVFPRIACGCYPPRALRGSWPKTRRSPLLAPVVSISSTGETEGTIAEKLLFASFPSPMILIFPCGKTEGSDIRNEEEKLFFLQKVFLFATSHREIANSLFKNAPYG